ncbi:MAG TPA: glycosyltransferase [Vicinamibacterales bacterium]|nr:glycosyltransferase [Vicinamibacterales bacterium]
MPVKPLVSVIIPTRNRAHCLPNALNSICAQEGLGKAFDVEIIVVDDASSDQTPDVVRGYPLVRYIRLVERRGVSGAQNEGLRAVQGSYVTFLGDDDEWLPHKLRVQVPLLAAHPEVDVVYSQALVRRDGSESLYPDATRAPSGSVFPAMLLESFCGHFAAFLARRTAFEKVGGFDESLESFEDYDLSLRLAFHFSFLFVSGAVTIYNPSPTGLWLGRAATTAGAADLCRVIDKALQMLPDDVQHLELKRKARARVALAAAGWLRDLEQGRTMMAGTLREYPESLLDGVSRDRVARMLEQAFLSESVARVRDICAQIEGATRGATATGRWWIRRVIAAFWARKAHALAYGPQPNCVDAAHAAFFALASAPWYLIRRPRLARIIARGLLWPAPNS